GVFDTNPSQTLYLFIDLKTDGPATYAAVHKSLEPLRAAGYLTTVTNNKTIQTGPITVIGTGNTPANLVADAKSRDIFLDGPLHALEGSDLTGKTAPIASTSFRWTIGDVRNDEREPLSEEQLERMRKHMREAKERGIGVRYWDVPSWPLRRRNAIWRVLVEEGVALLNTDDLQAVREYF
ncbi:hypothetical protein KEM56_000157, partial [Ascosphaera pollenicola]